MSQIKRNLGLLRQGRKVVQTLGLSRWLVNRAAEASRSDQIRTYDLKKGDKSKGKVEFWASPRLTGLLNRFDGVGSHLLGRNVKTSQGELVKADKGSVWHRGTSVLQTSRGERTLTHLQSLTLPGRHLYFERELSDRQVAGLVSGQTKPQAVPGYVGEISRNESLLPAWAMTKWSLIANRIYHPPASLKWEMKNEE